MKAAFTFKLRHPAITWREIFDPENKGVCISKLPGDAFFEEMASSNTG